MKTFSALRLRAGAGVVFACGLIACNLVRGATPSSPAWASTDGPNPPLGTGKGVYPGRVAWVYDPKAALWDSTGNWWADAFNNQTAIDQMVSQSVRSVTGQSTDAAAWDRLFHSFKMWQPIAWLVPPIFTMAPGAVSRYLRSATSAERLSLIIRNASAHWPPTSSARPPEPRGVLPAALRQRIPCQTELETRLPPAMSPSLMAGTGPHVQRIWQLAWPVGWRGIGANG